MQIPKKYLNKRFFEDFSLFDKTHFAVAKGIGIFIVVLVHLCNRHLNFQYLSPLAGAGVSVFLICSGYGLSESYKKNGLKYFWQNKIVKIWVPSFLWIAVHAILSALGFPGIFQKQFLFLYGWYLQTLFAFYLLFWLAFKYIQNRNLRLLIIFLVSAVAFCLISEQIYAEQMLCFPFGVLFSQLELNKKVEKSSLAVKFAMLVVPCIVLLCTFFLRNKFDFYLLFNLNWLLFKSALGFIILFVSYFARKIKVFGLFAPIGTVSYALYLLNDYFLSLLEKCVVSWYTVALVLLFLLFAACVYTWFCDMLYARFCTWRANRQNKSA